MNQLKILFSVLLLIATSSHEPIAKKSRHAVNIDSSPRSHQQSCKDSCSLAEAIEQYRSYAQENGIDEMIFFINLAESCIFDEKIRLQATAEEDNFIQELREFYMTFAFAYEQDKETLINNFAAKYKQISRNLQAMSTRLAQSIQSYKSQQKL